LTANIRDICIFAGVGSSSTYLEFDDFFIYSQYIGNWKILGFLVL